MSTKHPSHKKELNEELRAIYAEGDGEMPDLSKLDRKESSSFTKLLLKAIALLAVLSVAAWGGFFVWTQGVFQSKDVLVTSIEGPTDVLAGEEVFYTIRYDNNGDVPLAALEMQLNLPFGFELTSTSPAPTQEQTWTVGSVSAGTDGSIVIGGIFRTEVPSSQSLQAFFNYRPANFSSDFQDIETTTINVTGSIVSLTVSGPEKALPGDEVTYIVNVQNSGRTDTGRMEVRMDLPTDFTMTNAEPGTSKEDVPVWTFENLAPAELIAITINGTYTSSVSGEQTLVGRASFLDAEDVPLAQAEGDMVTDILGGGVGFTLIVDGAREDLTAELGDRIRISIDYANNGSDQVDGFALTLGLSTPDGAALPVDWENAELGEGTRTGNTIVWSEAEREDFASLAPSDTGVIDLTLPILESIDLERISDAFTVSLIGSMEKIGSVESPRSIEATPITVTLNSDLHLHTAVRYYTEDGEPLGTGPLPPTVSETTGYRVIWELENTLHTLENVIVTATLPTDVIWKDRTEKDIGTLSFNETTRLVSWQIDKLPVDLSEVTASFELTVTPDENDVGSFLKLTNATSVSAKDSISGGNISRANDILTTELPEDEYAKGKGIVTE